MNKETRTAEVENQSRSTDEDSCHANPFVPMSNYPRREGLAHKAREHARVTLTYVTCQELLSGLGFLFALAAYPIQQLGINHLLIVVPAGGAMLAFTMRHQFLYARFAGWSWTRLWISNVLVAAAIVIGAAFPLPGFAAICGTIAVLNLGVCKDLELLGLTTRGFGIPKAELRRILNADTFEVTPLG